MGCQSIMLLINSLGPCVATLVFVILSRTAMYTLCTCSCLGVRSNDFEAVAFMKLFTFEADGTLHVCVRVLWVYLVSGCALEHVCGESLWVWAVKQDLNVIHAGAYSVL